MDNTNITVQQQGRLPMVRKQHHYYSEYLNKSESTIERASRLFQAGEPEDVFSTDYREVPAASHSIFVKIMRKVFGSGPPKDRNITYDHIVPGRNKLIIFRNWIVRCTYQYYDFDRELELLYISGAPLSFVTRFVLISDDLVVYAFNSEFMRSQFEERVDTSAGSDALGGTIPIKADDRIRLITLFEKLKTQGRLHQAAHLREE